MTGVLLAFLGGGAMDVKITSAEGFNTSGYASAVMRMPNSFCPVRYSALPDWLRTMSSPRFSVVPSRATTQTT